MKTITTIAILIFCSFSIWAQSFTDKIRIVQNTYQNQAFSDQEKLYDSDTIILTSKRKISKLISELSEVNSESQLLSEFGLDTNYIINNTVDLLKLYDGYYKNELDWNEKQIDFIFEKLTDLDIYRTQLNQYLSKGCCYTMHHSYRYEYILILEEENEITNIFNSRKSIWGYHFPYIDQTNLAVFNYEIDKQLNKVFQRKLTIKEPLKGNALLKYLVNQIVDNNTQGLYKLSPYTYEKEMSELSTDFQIVSSEEVYGRGRYIWDEPKTMKITLKNEIMLPNVFLQYLCSKKGESLYPRDSIKMEYKDIVSRIQTISFITEYLQQDSTARLDIFYFNNNGINEYNIDGVNKNPVEWQKQDEYIESLKWYENSDIEPSFDIDKAIKTSERNYCGCNYRFKREFLEKAIFFELTSNRNASSIWFLLPDDTVLLYHVESYHLEDARVIDNKLIKYGELNLPWACLLFDKKGNIINKE